MFRVITVSSHDTQSAKARAKKQEPSPGEGKAEGATPGSTRVMRVCAYLQWTSGVTSVKDVASCLPSQTMASAPVAAATSAVAAASHRISLPAFIARPGFVAKEPLREGPPLEAAALVERLDQLLRSDPALFLERYGEWLQAEELAPFEGGGYECTWHLARLRRSTQQREQERRNRRFRCMAEMLKGEGGHADYFSVEKMQAWDDRIARCAMPRAM